MYYIWLTIFFILFETYLFLNRNIWIGLFIFAFVFILNIIFHKNFLKGIKGYLLLIISVFIILIFTEAPKKLVFATYENAEITPVINVSEGSLTGVYNKDKTVEVYAGIPYAKPPVGDLRWKEPQDPEPYKDILVADHYGPMAMQPKIHTVLNSISDIFFYKNINRTLTDRFTPIMSEDCLYLNIFKPANNKKNLPVIFYIHGGSLTTGQAWWKDYNGESFAKEDVIFVTFSYRLGALGFYADEDLQKESGNNTTGMYGFLDQVKALQWINKNIASFGGNPNNITIAGESAGSSSVNAMCTSPLAKGLFKYAIMESSSITAKFPAHSFIDFSEALQQGKSLKNALNINTIEELRNISAEKIIKAKTKYNTINALTNDGYALIKPPYESYLKGENNEKALLHGYNKKDGDFFLLTSNSINMKNYEKTLKESYPYIAEQLIKMYPASNDKEAQNNFKIIYNAYTFGYGHHVLSTLASNNIPVYEYFFTKNNKSIGSNHTGELYYAYGNLSQNPSTFDKSDKSLEKIMMNYWLSFIKTGNPNNNNNPAWYVYSKNNILQLDEEVKMIEDPNYQLYELMDKYINEANN